MKRRNFLHSLLGVLGGSLSHRVYAKISPIQTRRRLILQESPLAGYQYHRAAAIWPFLQVGEKLYLKREPSNQHDPHAVAVWFRNEHLGYVPRRENRTLAKLMDQGERLETRITRLLTDEQNPWRKIRFRVEMVS
ncbi:MAG: HIRAN domain-containing protein [Candidatus Thiodiazotropha sp. (ex Semelilucina semeliformis)]|nr:HIRAN domain-containing protein [Candidatus Thiodiazotropha sp. (ex Myrtea spinifera)]MCU7807564.1 HIRAN domain-containing protein [Candidatus Thiodiazotropha sp. (ex Semelilucina semeliformis)]MCU7828034.1 HIRAN domain-containing protein [Candidatus Thiodiazotropha sp. (ex Myrtea sp. 'scaly one' KF741663)]